MAKATKAAAGTEQAVAAAAAEQQQIAEEQQAPTADAEQQQAAAEEDAPGVDLIDATRGITADRDRQRWRRYVELLTHPRPTEELAEELVELAESIGRAANMREDQRALANARDFVRTIEQGRGLDEKIAAAQRAVMEHHEHMQREIVRMRGEHVKLNQASDALTGRVTFAWERTHALETLRKANPKLLADVPRFDPTTFEAT
jgi:hypothetical protein